MTTDQALITFQGLQGAAIQAIAALLAAAILLTGTRLLVRHIARAAMLAGDPLAFNDRRKWFEPRWWGEFWYVSEWTEDGDWNSDFWGPEYWPAGVHLDPTGL